MTGWRRRIRRAIGFVVLMAPLAAAERLSAENWGGLTPGETNQAGVEAIYGKPSRDRPVVEEGRTVAEWTYAGDRAPRGLERMVISFGFMVSGRFAPEVVRSIVLYPKPHVFSLLAISNGWGKPDAIGTEESTGRPSFHYRTLGLFIILDKTGSWAELLLFSPRQAAGGA